MNELEFKLVENGTTISYKYFGRLIFGGMDSGFHFDYPEPSTKPNWYKKLKEVDYCTAAAALGSLYHYLKIDNEAAFKETWGEDVFQVVSSKPFGEFVKKWLYDNGNLFNEDYFFDGHFGRFSSEGLLGYPDNEEDLDSKRWTWKNEGITLLFKEKCYEGDWRDKLFIDESFESEFNLELSAIINLFNSKSE